MRESRVSGHYILALSTVGVAHGYYVMALWAGTKVLFNCVQLLIAPKIASNNKKLPRIYLAPALLIAPKFAGCD